MSDNSKVVRASVLRGFGQFVRNCGVAEESLLLQAGLSLKDIATEDTDLPFDKVARLFDLAADATGDKAFALSFAKAYQVGGWGLFGYLFMHSRNVEEAFRTVVRFIPLVKIPFKFSFETNGDDALIAWRPTDDVSLDHQQIFLYGPALMIVRLRRLAPPDWHPLKVELTIPNPGCDSEMTEVFGPNMVYSSIRNAIHIDKETLSHPVPQATPDLRDYLERIGEKELAGLSATDDRLIHETRSEILKWLGHRRITLDDVASALGCSSRTLQSRLASLSTTFEEILNDARKLRAEQLMQTPGMSLTEIAYQLGFSEPSAFTRAAQRWFGRSPSAQRQRLKSP